MPTAISIKTNTVPGTVSPKGTNVPNGEVVTWDIDTIKPGDLMRIEFKGTLLAGFNKSASAAGDKTITITFNYFSTPPPKTTKVPVAYSVYVGAIEVVTDSLVIDTIDPPPPPPKYCQRGEDEPGEYDQGYEEQN